MKRLHCLFACLITAGLFAAISFPAFAQEKKNPAIVPQPRKGGWMNRHKSMNKRVAKGNVDLVFIGDSITHGWEGGGRKVWAKYYAKRNAVNLGIGGDRTEHVIWRLEHGNLKGISPKLAVIMIGTNNASAGHSPKQIAEGIKVIIGEVQMRTPKTKILLLAIFPRGKDNNDRRRQVNEKTNEIIKNYADNKRVYYLDIGKHFLKDDNGTLPRDIMPDLLHPNARGYMIWAEAIEPKVSELMGEKK